MSATSSDAPPAGRPSRRFEARKQAILVSAIKAINRSGVRGMTLARVAASLDLVPTGVVYYFKNKEALAAACFLRAIERFNGLLEVAEREAAPGPRAAAFLRGYVELKRHEAVGEAEPLVGLHEVRALNAPAVNEASVAMFRRARRLLEGAETACLERSERNARTYLLLSEAICSARWLSKTDPEDYARAGARMADIALEGLAAPGQAFAPRRVPPLTPARERSGEEISRTTFLRAATELINEQGYLGASVEKISARLSVTKGAFYHHNQTKDDLVMACFEHTRAVVQTALRAAESVARNGLESLVTAASALVEHQVSGDAPLLRASALLSAPDAIGGAVAAHLERLTDRFASIISDGVADGSIRPIDARIGARMVSAMIVAAGELHHWASGATAKTAPALFVRPLFQGLLVGANPQAVARPRP